jgi:hypothetical protein
MAINHVSFTKRSNNLTLRLKQVKRDSYERHAMKITFKLLFRWLESNTKPVRRIRNVEVIFAHSESWHLGVKWTASSCRHFTPGKVSSTHSTGDWVSPRVDLDVTATRKLLLQPRIEHRYLSSTHFIMLLPSIYISSVSMQLWSHSH